MTSGSFLGRRAIYQNLHDEELEKAKAKKIPELKVSEPEVGKLSGNKKPSGAGQKNQAETNHDSENKTP
ncbi:MAG: hypothetical protein WAW02_03640 [Sideroxyarcus sp.]